MVPEMNMQHEASNVANQPTIKNFTDLIRGRIKGVGNLSLELKARLIAEPIADKELNSEAIANAVLAFRHLEDAAMRLGKVLQALNGGESIYDNSGVVSQTLGSTNGGPTGLRSV